MSIMRAEEVINSSCFIREPVDDVRKKINNSDKDRIILNGGRGTGKSVVLNEIQQKGLGTDNQTVLLRFDSAITFNKAPNQYYSREFFINYYELEMANYLLGYIKKYYGLYYEKYFVKTWNEVKRRLDNIIKYANNVAFGDIIQLDKFLDVGEITTKLIKDMKDIIGIDSLNIAFDRFDWTNGKSAFTQVLLRDYFNMFDKAIITTDDMDFNEDKHIQDGYDIMTVDYGKDIDIIKKIIKNRIKVFCDRHPNVVIDNNKLTDDIYEYIATNTNGNISSIINIITCFLSTYEWREGLSDYFATIEYETFKENQTVKQLKKMGPQPKLYI